MQLDLLMALTLARLQQAGCVPVEPNTPTISAAASSSSALVVSANSSSSASASSSSSSSSSSSPSSDDEQLHLLPAERLLRPALLGRLLGAGAAAVAFGQRIDHARASWLAAAHWLAQRVAPSFPREFDDEDHDSSASGASGAKSAKSALASSSSSAAAASTSATASSVLPSATAQSLAQCTVFFLLQATRALDQDASFARRLDALSAAAAGGGALAKLTAAEAAQVSLDAGNHSYFS